MKKKGKRLSPNKLVKLMNRKLVKVVSNQLNEVVSILQKIVLLIEKVLCYENGWANNDFVEFYCIIKSSFFLITLEIFCYLFVYANYYGYNFC